MKKLHPRGNSCHEMMQMLLFHSVSIVFTSLFYRRKPFWKRLLDYYSLTDSKSLVLAGYKVIMMPSQ